MGLHKAQRGTAHRAVLVAQRAAAACGCARCAAWNCAGEQHAAAQRAQHAAVLRCCVGLRCAQRGIAHGRSVGLCKGRGMGPRRGAAAAALERRMRLRWGTTRDCAAWSRAWAPPGAAGGRSSVGLRGGTAVRGCAGAQQPGAAQRRSRVGLRRGAADWSCAGAQQRGAAQGRSSVELCWGAAARSCAGAQLRGAAQGRSMGLRRGAAASGCAKAQQHGAA